MRGVVGVKYVGGGVKKYGAGYCERFAIFNS